MFIKSIRINEDIWFNLSRKSHKKFKNKSRTYTEVDYRKPIYEGTGRGIKTGYEKRKVTEKKFRIFEKGFELNFNNNLTIIVGDNGCGKTTFLKYLKLPREPLVWLSNEEEKRKEFYKEWITNNIRTLNFIAQPEYYIIENNIHKNSFIENFKNHKETLNPTELLTLWDMQDFSNGENTIDFIEALKDCKNGLIVLDEPETSLSIKSQKKIGKDILELSKSNQVIVITHSPYLMQLSKEIYDFEAKEYVNTSKYLDVLE